MQIRKKDREKWKDKIRQERTADGSRAIKESGEMG